jgi:trimeric autotransporter adhesin
VTNATGRVALYGGATPADNSGRITFLQIRYPGAFLTSAAAGDDLNGLTLSGVGSATTIDNVQVHNSGDDGIEIFGGTVNMKHVILTGALDDSLDCDEAWTGNVQFLIVKQTALAGGPDGLLECSNRPVSSVGGTLQTRPTIANFTFVGLLTNSAGAALKGIGIDASAGGPGASGRFVNGVETGSTRCLSVTDPETGAGRGNADTVNPPTFNSILFDCPGAYSAQATTFINAGTNNTTTTANTLTLAPAPSTALTNFVNGANETARTPVDVTTLGAFFTAAPYIGAVRNAADTWWRGWTCGLEAVTC